ncbi:ABC transporter ATP-binding protein (plasmid) [Rhizobium sp. NIBRBAC000502774]|nr:ABC transporter ATP-binding protein [Rhizobium sp. NIBRBAC000502774]
MDSLLDISGLEVEFPLKEGVLQAVKGVSFTVGRGETLCLVGESGSGKSLTALSLLNLLPAGARRRMDRAVFAGEDFSRFGERQMQDLRGRDIGMIFQDPMMAFNPTMTIGRQLEEVNLRHVSRDRRKARARAIGLLERVGVTRAETRMDEYPHQLSGGLRQRAMIAMALMCEPKLLIADEPTTALDVTMQAQVLSLLKSVQETFGIAILFITHDLGVVAAIADRIAVMKSGVIVETGDVEQVLGNPREAYTRALIASVPKAPVLTALPFAEAANAG